MATLGVSQLSGRALHLDQEERGQRCPQVGGCGKVVGGWVGGWLGVEWLKLSGWLGDWWVI